MKKYKLNKGLIQQQIDDKLTIFDGENSTLFTLNETASFIFNELKKGKKANTIITKIAKKYQISKKKAEKDFNLFLSKLTEKKIISVSKKKIDVHSKKD